MPAPESSSGLAAALRERLEQKTAVIGIVGLGYVGLPLVRAFHDAGLAVIGYDIDPAKIDALRAGRSYIRHLGESFFRELAASRRFTPTSNPADLERADAVLLCVPTPLNRHREPDLSFVIDSTRMVARHLRRGQLIILESTTYPGTTRDEMRPILEAGGLKAGMDFFLAYSPEREDPGTPGRSATHITKVVGGIDPVSTGLAAQLYRSIAPSVHVASSCEVAEASKLLENIYRAVNIALVNELKVVFEAMGIDIWEVIAASSTKPFGYQPFYPGPGLGGHCIPIDPFYLTWKAREVGCTTRFIELAGEINARMPEHIVEKLAAALNERGRALRGSRILILGVAYKPNVDDIRESPAAEIIEQLQHRGAVVSYHDPHVPTFPKMRRYQIELVSVPLNERSIGDADAVLIVTHHDAIDYALIGRHASLVVDTRNAMSRVPAGEVSATVIKA
jgi:UDP-N-acetyl-D-glucosamine dehydrogenase